MADQDPRPEGDLRPDGDPPREGDDEEAAGNGALFGVLFAVALTVGALVLMTRMRDAAALLDCAFTHAPQCREQLK